MTNATKEDLMELYEARGDEAAFREAVPLFESTVASAPSPEDLRHYALAPDDPILIYDRGEARSKTGDPEGALADWRRSLDLEPEDIGPLYMSAFLFEREGRIQEAIEAWRSILDWSQARDNQLDMEWPARELERLTPLAPHA